MQATDPGLLVLLLFVIAAAVAIVARRVRVPYTVALVVAGLVLGPLRLFAPPHLTKALLFTVFLPGLVFEAALHLEWRAFWRDRLAILLLALPGVVVSMLVTAALLVGEGRLAGATARFGWLEALVFGALIAATDPIAVVGLLRTMGAPRRLATIMEAESLLNDGTAIVLFSLVLGLATTPGDAEAAGPGAIALGFVATVGLGGLVGAVVGLAVGEVIRRVDAASIEITLTMIAGYGAFIAGERLGVSGVIATVVAGLVAGNHAARIGMTPSTRVAVEAYWEYLAFALNSLVFLLIGFAVRFEGLVAAWRPILLAYLAVLLARAVMVGGTALLLGRRPQRLPGAWTAVLTWGGLRGGISMVLVLGLPATFPARDTLIAMTFGVVVLQLLLNGLTTGPLMRRLGLARGAPGGEAYEAARADVLVTNAALAEIERLATARLADPALLDELRRGYETRLAAREGELRSLHVERAEVRDLARRRTVRHLLLVERDHALEALRQGMITQETYDRLLPGIDAQLVRLDTDGGSPEAEDGSKGKRRA